MVSFPFPSSVEGFSLILCAEQEVERRPPITVKFEIPYFTVSGIQVRYLKIVEKSGYQALPWVRYITQNGDDYRWANYVFRWGDTDFVDLACVLLLRKGARLLDRRCRYVPIQVVQNFSLMTTIRCQV